MKLNHILAFGLLAVLFFGCSSDIDHDYTINGHEYVDLGLPSGLKWATCNIGASSPTEFGDYFAWGETESKETYTAENSKTYGKELYDISGNPEYDAARANWGGTWRMPTKDEIEELIDNCNWEWRESWNGVAGCLVTGSNGNSIFIPAAGYCDGSSLDFLGYSGSYWCSTSYNYLGAYQLYFNSNSHYIGNNFLYDGQSIRAVSE